MPDVRDYGARGDGTADDTAALQHALDKGDGRLDLPRGQYRITRPLRVSLSKLGPMHINGHGGLAKIIMDGPGPALHLIGTHKGSALPASVPDAVWQKERLPIITGIEIVGQHAEADGIRIEGAMQPTLHQVLIRKCRHGVHLTSRDRNVLIADCHIYDNSGIGIFLDRVNLHQTNIHGNHISYCKQGGIRIAASEIRNIQICSNDIEYNYDLKAESSADVFFDCRNGTVREGTIVGNTIQAVQSPGGANIRLLGAGPDNPNAVGLLAITGNLLGSQTTVLDLQACRGVSVTGNSIYSGYRNAIWAENCEHLVISGNSIDHNPEYRGASTDRVLIRRSRNVNVSGLLLQHTRPASEEVASSIEVSECQGVNITGCQVVAGRTRGIAISNCTLVRVADCTLRGPAQNGFRAALAVDEKCRHIMVVNNFLGRGSDGDFKLPQNVGVAAGNVMIEQDQ